MTPDPSSPPLEQARARTAPPPLRGIRAAFVLLTRLPVGGFPYAREDWKWAAAHAPLVGWALGGVLGLFDRLLAPLGAWPSAWLVMGASLLATGAFHEDGLADTADALGGGRTPARVFAILKDSRIGAFGGAALVVSIGARAALLAQLGAAGAGALPIAACAARVGPAWLIASLPYVTPEGEAKSLDVMRAGWLAALVATFWFAVAVAVAFSVGAITVARAAGVAVALAATTTLSGTLYCRRVGGITGDFLGATEQVGEIAALAVFAWRA